jgi:SAM-dependent methyltransferase
LDYSKFTFVDLGSGKGRVLMVAAKFSFARAVGVEFSPELHEIAVRNIGVLAAQTSSCSSVEALCLDAAAYEFPATPLVVYLYNPFLPPLMRIVMQHLADSLRSSPRPVYVVLGGDDSLAPIVEASAFVRLPLPGIPAASWVFLTPADLPSFEDRLRDSADV